MLTVAVPVVEQGSYRVPIAIAAGVGEWGEFYRGFHDGFFDYFIPANHLVGLSQSGIGFGKRLLQALGRDLHLAGDDSSQSRDDVAAR